MSENPAEAPKNEGNNAETAEVKKEHNEAIEYDDFGLPIRKRRPRTPVQDSSDSEGEQFEDAVASTPPSPDKVAIADQEKEQVKADDTQTKLPETVPEGAETESDALPHVNGQVKEPVEKADPNLPEDKPVETKQDTPE